MSFIIQPGASGSFTLLSTITTTGSATVDVESGFSSTYDNYLIIASNVKSSHIGNAALLARLKIAGTYQTSSQYYWTFTQTSNINPTTTGPGTRTSMQLLPSVDYSPSGFRLNAHMILDDVNNTAAYKQVRGNFSQVVSVANTDAGVFSASWIDTPFDALTGVRFFFSNGNVIGTFKLYGLSK